MQCARKRSLMIYRATKLLQKNVKQKADITLICLDNTFSDTTNHVKTISYTNPCQLILDIYKNKYDFCIFTSWSGEETFIVDIVKDLNIPLICDFQDCAEGLSFLTENDLRIKRQRYCIGNSDGLLVRDPRWHNFYQTKWRLEKTRHIIFHDYLEKKAEKINFLSTKKQKNLIFLGSFGLGEAADELGWEKIIPVLLKQKFFIYFIPSPGHSTYNITCPYFRISQQNKRFALIPPQNQAGLLKYQEKCAFGLNINQLSIFKSKIKTVKKKYLHNCSSNRNYDYAESGLGVIMSNDLLFMRKIFDDSGSSISVNSKTIFMLNDLIHDQLKNFSIKSYKAWQNNNLLENNIKEFKHFTHSFIKNKKNKIQPKNNFCLFIIGEKLKISLNSQKTDEPKKYVPKLLARLKHSFQKRLKKILK